MFIFCYLCSRDPIRGYNVTDELLGRQSVLGFVLHMCSSFVICVLVILLEDLMSLTHYYVKYRIGLCLASILHFRQLNILLQFYAVAHSFLFHRITSNTKPNFFTITLSSRGLRWPVSGLIHFRISAASVLQHLWAGFVQLSSVSHLLIGPISTKTL